MYGAELPPILVDLSSGGVPPYNGPTSFGRKPNGGQSGFHNVTSLWTSAGDSSCQYVINSFLKDYKSVLDTSRVLMKADCDIKATAILDINTNTTTPVITPEGPSKLMDQQIQLFVKFLNFKTLLIDVHNQGNISVIEDELKKLMTLPEDLYMVCEGKRINPLLSFSSNGISNMSSIYISIPLRGGSQSTKSRKKSKKQTPDEEPTIITATSSKDKPRSKSSSPSRDSQVELEKGKQEKQKDVTRELSDLSESSGLDQSGQNFYSRDDILDLIDKNNQQA